MKTITFQGKENNFYHTLKEHSVITEGQVIKGKASITGHTKEPIEVGDVFNISGQNFEVEEIVERRNHSGDFINPDDKIDSFFRVECKFERIINLN